MLSLQCNSMLPGGNCSTAQYAKRFDLATKPDFIKVTSNLSASFVDLGTYLVVPFSIQSCPTAINFDWDGDLDIASTSLFDGYIGRKGFQWHNYTIYVGEQGHYFFHSNMDGGGGDNLISVTHAENTVAVFLAKTKCDIDSTNNATASCHLGME
eukprot:13350702-Ditylum_brightwellii.AAC.1